MYSRDKFSYSANNLTADQAAEKKIIKQQSEEPTFIEELPLHDAFQLLKSKYSVMQKKHVGERHELQVKFDELQKEHHIQLDKTRILEERVKLLKADLDETKRMYY